MLNIIYQESKLLTFKYKPLNIRRNINISWHICAIFLLFIIHMIVMCFLSSDCFLICVPISLRCMVKEKKVLIYLILLKNRTPRIEKNKKEEYKRSFTRKVLRNRTLCYKKSRYQLLSLFATFFFYYTYISHSTFWYLHASYLSKKKKNRYRRSSIQFFKENRRFLSYMQFLFISILTKCSLII